MICLKPLVPNTPDAALADALNRRAFPENEYVPMAGMMAEVPRGEVEILGVYVENRFSGFLVMRCWEGIAYVAFFAISEEARCQGVGGQSLRLLQDYYPGKQIVVDFEAVDDEAPNAAQRRRRRAFYLRNGLHPTGWYAYYSETEFEIVCSGEEFDDRAFCDLFAHIHRQFPDFDPRVYRKDT